MDKKQKAEEARLRRMADERGYILRRSRLRKIGWLAYGKYVLLDAKTGEVVAGGVMQPPEEPMATLRLSEVREWLEHGEGKPRVERYSYSVTETPNRPRLNDPIEEVSSDNALGERID